MMLYNKLGRGNNIDGFLKFTTQQKQLCFYTLLYVTHKRTEIGSFYASLERWGLTNKKYAYNALRLWLRMPF